MHTEQEALELWCPLARVGNSPGCNRYPMEHDLATGHAFARCLGTSCAMWRWGRSKWKQEAKPGHTIFDFPNGGVGPVFFDHESQVRISTPTNGVKKPEEIKLGYCGLAGSPAR